VDIGLSGDQAHISRLRLQIVNRKSSIVNYLSPIIERTCTFDAKFYKIVDGVLAVSLCVKWNKKFFRFFDFSFQLPSFLVEFLDKILPNLTVKLRNLPQF
jgi:hypothetical protein